jgi:nicastrin
MMMLPSLSVLVVVCFSIFMVVVSAGNSKGSAATFSFDEPFQTSFSQLIHFPCTTLFTKNSRIGCGTESRQVQKGNILYFNYDGSALQDPGKDFVAVIEEADWTYESMKAFGKLEHLQGILIVNSTNSQSSSSSSSSSNNNNNIVYSPDSRTPQGYGTPSADITYGNINYAWNPKGENLLEQLIPYPVAFVADSDIASSLLKYAKGQSNIMAEFQYYMGPNEMNSFDCLSWKDESTGRWNPKCLPLGGNSVWATAGSPPNPNNDKRNVIFIAAAMDSTAFFHDLAYGANTAASNILTVIMAAKLIGANMNDQALDALSKRIAFGLFQGEAYGYIGSRRFLRDHLYFQCGTQPVKVGNEYACLNPPRQNLKFADFGKIVGMLTVDQIGHAVANGILYLHADPDKSYDYYLANLIKYTSGSVVFSSAGNNNNDGNGGFPYPPTPLTSLLSITKGDVGGVVLTGYDYAFTSRVPYHSHWDVGKQISLSNIAAAATILARSAVAAAYDDGTYYNNNEYDTPAQYAKSVIAEDLAEDDELLVQLANCFLYDGSCETLRKYSAMEANNEKLRSGVAYGQGQALGTPPNYFVGVYNDNSGQPFVRVNDQYYGSYNGSDFGSRKSDGLAIVPRQLESSIRGIFNDLLGRGSAIVRDNGKNNHSCKSTSDCKNLDYCGAYGDEATCTGGGVCVCLRSQYHVALDEGIAPAANQPPGYFTALVNENTVVTPMYTEPYWSSSVGVKLYRSTGPAPGFVSLGVGLAIGFISLFGAFVLKVGLKKEKLY